jgi:hypothetical protein
LFEILTKKSVIQEMATNQIKWLLRLGIPMAAFVTALLCGQDVTGAMKVVALTAGIIAISMIEIFGILGIAFAGVVFIYSRNAERDLGEPDSILILVISSAATLLTVGLLATLLK